MTEHERYRADVTLTKDYVLVTHSALPSVAVAEVLQSEIERQLARGRLDRVLIDTRAMEAPPADARNAMWAWCEAHPRLWVALVVNSEIKRVTANMDAVSRRIRIRSFHSIEEAERWLRARPAAT